MGRHTPRRRCIRRREGPLYPHRVVNAGKRLCHSQRRRSHSPSRHEHHDALGTRAFNGIRFAAKPIRRIIRTFGLYRLAPHAGRRNLLRRMAGACRGEPSDGRRGRQPVSRCHVRSQRSAKRRAWGLRHGTLCPRSRATLRPLPRSTPSRQTPRWATVTPSRQLRPWRFTSTCWRACMRL